LAGIDKLCLARLCEQLCDDSWEHAAAGAIVGPVPAKLTGRKLLAFDRKLGARFVAGADEAGRGPLAGPLVVAGVLLDLECLRHNRARPLSLLNDSKQLDRETREELYRAVVACAERVSVHVFPPAVIDRDGLHRSNLRGLREALRACQPAEVCLVDGFRLGPTAPEHRAVVDGDEKSAAIAAASIVAKVTRDRYMHNTADAVYPAYGFSSHVGYITPAHSAIVRAIGPCEIHRRSFEARCYAEEAAA
jgi:ribonuclease HII